MVQMKIMDKEKGFLLSIGDGAAYPGHETKRPLTSIAVPKARADFCYSVVSRGAHVDPGLEWVLPVPLKRSMTSLVLDISPQGSDSFQFLLQHEGRSLENVVPCALPASIAEDLRILRWQAVGLVDHGDIFLESVGRRLGALVIPPNSSAQWLELLGISKRLVLRFERGTEMLLNLPWELLHTGKDFFLRESGCHIVREIQSGRPGADHRDQDGILHISYGVDSALRLDEERCSLLDIFPMDVPVTFLLNPTLEELAYTVETLKPMVVIISGHGSYDDISNVHSIESLEGKLETHELIQSTADCGCRLLLLWTCESARLGVPLQFLEKSNDVPPDLISFTYPVSSRTAILAVRILFERLLAGEAIDLAADAVRGVDYRDSYAFFNLVHYHQTGMPFFRLRRVNGSRDSHHAGRCAGREFALTVLDVKARENRVTTIVAPVGCGAFTLLRHWSDLNSRSASLRTINVEGPTDLGKLRRVSAHVGWLVLLSKIDIPRANCSIVRWIAPADYDGNHSGGAMLLAELEGDAAEKKNFEILGNRANIVASHPLAGVPGFIAKIANGATPDQAQEWFELANRMSERMDRLSEAGRLFASWLYTIELPPKVGNRSYERFAEDQKQMGFDPPLMLKGIVDGLAARVILRIEGSLFLAPEFRLLGDKWFPSWRTDHLKAFRTMMAVFATLDKNGTFEEDLGFHLLRWAERIEEWRAASLLSIRISEEMGACGSLEQMEPYIRRIRPHVVDATEQIIFDGHLAKILLDGGKPAEALVLHAELERRAANIPDTEEEYFINLIASLTQQVDCLLALDRPMEAEEKLNQANEVYARWPDPDGDVEPRLLALRASLAAENGDFEDAERFMSRAIDVTKGEAGILLAELHTAKCEYFRKQGKIEEALAELEFVNRSGHAEVFASRYLHLKGLILEQAQDRRWIDHILESYERDRIAERWEGVTISLLTVARIFIDNQEYERARERLREAFAYINTKGLTGQIATFMLLWGEIELATKSSAEARPWFALAQKRASLDRNKSVQDRATRFIE